MINITEHCKLKWISLLLRYPTLRMHKLMRCNPPNLLRPDPLGLVCLVLPMLCVAMVAFTVAAVKYQFFLGVPSNDLSPLLDELQKFTAPELIERRTFLAQLFFTPLISIFLLHIIIKSDCANSLINRLSIHCVPLIFCITLLYLVFNGEYTKAMLGSYGETSTHTIRWYLLSAVFTYIFFFWTRNSRFVSGDNCTCSGFILLYLTLLLALLFAWRIISINSITNDISYSQHLDPIAYVISQVIQGKKLLIDLPSQYGLYPQLISRIFNIIGSSVLSLTIVFGILQLIAMLAIYFVGYRHIKNQYILAIFALVLLIATNGTPIYLINHIDHYFQYWPIRLITPALSLFVFYFYLKRPNLLRLFYCSQLGALSLLWNIDSGVVVTFSILVYLIFTAIFKALPHQSFRLKLAIGDFKEIIFFVLITSVSTCSYFYLLFYEHNAIINTEWLLGYQKLFYGLGYYMLPMPISRDPWMAIILVYALGILIFFAGKFTSSKSKKIDIIFYLSILGVGLFSYYQGRSHPLNLINVSWPALLIIAIVTDSYLHKTSNQRYPKIALIAPSLAVAALNLSAFTLIINIPKIFLDVSNQYRARDTISDPLIHSELRFIKDFSQGQDCAIFSKRQGIYHLELGMRSSLPGPSIVETVLKRDRELQLTALRNGSVRCLFWGVGDSQVLALPDDLMNIFKIKATNQEKTLLYMSPKAED